jgi:AraC-like DNA-binding protein
MMVRLSTTLWLIVTLRVTSSFHRGRQRYRVRVRRRSAISILQRSKSMVASAGSVVLATTGEASLRLQCIGTKPSLDGDSSPRTLSGQQVEAKIGCNVLNRMTSFGMPATDPDRLMPLPAGKPRRRNIRATKRVEAARRRVEESEDRIESVAEDSGFSNEEQMRCSFIRILGIPPREYRRRFATTV